MSAIRRFLAVSVVTAAILGAAAAPSSAVVGGNDASPGEYPAVAEITFGPFLCTGTLITPDWVLSAGHCGSVTGAAVATPASWPPQLINVRIGGVNQNELMAIGWSYAAVVHLGLAPAVVFHAGGYQDGGQTYLRNVAEGRYLAVPMLQWVGLTLDRKRACEEGAAPYPHMRSWLRTE